MKFCTKFLCYFFNKLFLVFFISCDFFKNIIFNVIIVLKDLLSNYFVDNRNEVHEAKNLRTQLILLHNKTCVMFYQTVK